MIRISAILVAIAFALGMYYVSSWRLGRELDQKSTPLKDPALMDLAQRMAHELDLPNIKVNIYEIDPVNGLAAPDGRIFITRGFMNKYRDGSVTAPELASVIAHELGHVALGHTKRRRLDFVMANAIRVIVFAFVGRFIPALGVYVSNLLMRLLISRLSRQDEYEADAYASALMFKSGIGVQPQIDMFKKLDYLTGNKKRPPAWIVSHPETAARIAAIEDRSARWSK